MVKEKLWRDLTVMWSDKDTLVSRPKCKSPIEQTGLYPTRFIVSHRPGPVHSINSRANIPFTQFVVDYMGRTHSLDKLSGEWERPE